MYSALHHDGKRLYELAREGVVVERKPRPVTIYSLQLLGVETNDTARLRVACGEGTYIRSLCSDLGERTGGPAHMGALVREASGPFVLSEALTLEQIARDPAAALLAPETHHPVSAPSSSICAARLIFEPEEWCHCPQGAVGLATSSCGTNRGRSSASEKRWGPYSPPAKFSFKGCSEAMQVLHALERTSTRPLALAIGFFDGFHRGHRELARRALRLSPPAAVAKRRSLVSQSPGRRFCALETSRR